MGSLSDVTAVILAGGLGTRLRPLTEKIPKPLVPIANVPLLALYLEKLRRSGVGRALILCGPDRKKIEPWAGSFSRGGFRAEVLEEPEPLGTGGAFALAASGVRGLILGFNGDILWDLDIQALVSGHVRNGARITVVGREVPDPGRYGLLASDGGDRVLAWIEKPSPEAVLSHAGPHRVNAGIYVLDSGLFLETACRGSFSMEKDFYPEALGRKVPFFLHPLKGPWRDIGTPESYLEANQEALRGEGPAREGFEGVEGRRVEAEECEDGPRLLPPALIGPGASLSPGAEIGPGTVVGPACVIEAGARVSRSVLCEGVRVGSGAVLDRIIAGPGARIRAGSRPAPLAILV